MEFLLQVQRCMLLISHVCNVRKQLFKRVFEHVIYATDYKNDEYALKLFAQSGVSVQHIPFDEKKVDFSSESKLELIQ